MTDDRGPAAELWDLIEQRRIQKGLNISELARQSGVARSTVKHLGAATRPPLQATVIALAEVLDIDQQQAFKLAGLGATAVGDWAPQPRHPERDGRSEMAAALRRRLPDLDDATLARVAMAMSDILQGVASQLFDEASRRQP